MTPTTPFIEIARFSIVFNELQFPKWKTYPELDECDGVHAEDILKGRAEAIEQLQANNYTAVLFSRRTPAADKAILYNDLEALINAHTSNRLSTYVPCLVFPYIWKHVNQLNHPAQQIFSIDSQGNICWSDPTKYSIPGKEYTFSETTTEFLNRKNDFDTLDEHHLFLVII